MDEIVRWNRNSTALQRLEQALEQERQYAPALRLEAAPLAQFRAAPLPPRVDLLRVCAQHGGQPWAAVYLLNRDGGYDYSTSIAVTRTLYRAQYAPGVAEPVVWDDRWIDEETCALCGVAGIGPVRCGVCRQLVCHGRSTGRYFRCCCGAENWMQNSGLQHPGVIPKLSR